MCKPNDVSIGRKPVAVICPSCRQPIELGELGTPESFGLAPCECTEYPVVAGIPLIFAPGIRIPETRVTIDEIKDLLVRRDSQGALAALVRPPDLRPPPPATVWKFLPSYFAARNIARLDRDCFAQWFERFTELAQATGDGSCRALSQHYFDYYNRSLPSIGHYFSYKFSQPRLLSSLGILDHADLSEGPLLDVGCANGVLLHHLEFSAGNQPVVGVDRNFFLLWLAKTRICKTSQLICTDVSFGLPFPSQTFRSIVSANVIQFIYNKAAVVAEMERVAQPRGFIALTAVRHAGVQAETRNQAISVSAYQNLFSVPTIAIDESEVVLNYRSRHQPSLAPEASMDPEQAANAPLIAIVASADRKVFRPGKEFSSWPHLVGEVGVNPLYVTSPAVDGFRLDLRWPSEDYVRDNQDMRDMLPQSAMVRAADFEALRRGIVRPQVEPLVSAGVFVDLPQDY